MTIPNAAPLNTQGTPVVTGETPNPMFGRWLDYINRLAAFIQGLFATGGSLATVPDSLAKAWVSFTGATGAILTSFNVSGVVRNAAGDYTISFTTAFASANYVCVLTSANGNAVLAASVLLAGSIEVLARNSSTGAVLDPTTVHVVCFGR